MTPPTISPPGGPGDDRLGLDLPRVFAWGYAQAVLAAAWAIEDGDDPAAGLATAEALGALI